MGWSEIIKAVNSNISVPLNKLITSAKDSLDAAITNVKSGVDTSITSAKNELSTLIKKNGTSYPNVIVGTLTPGEKIEVAGKGKVTLTTVQRVGVTVNFGIDSKLYPTLIAATGELKTLTFEKNIYLLNSTSSPYDSNDKLAYLLQLTE